MPRLPARPPAPACQQGPQPPNPLVMERFQQVISQLFQQRIVRLGGAGGHAPPAGRAGGPARDCCSCGAVWLRQRRLGCPDCPIVNTAQPRCACCVCLLCPPAVDDDMAVLIVAQLLNKKVNQTGERLTFPLCVARLLQWMMTWPT